MQHKKAGHYDLLFVITSLVVLNSQVVLKTIRAQFSIKG